MNSSVLQQLAGLLGAQGLLTDPAQMAPSLSDWRGRYHGRAQAILRPASTAELAAAVVCCAQAGIAIVPQGGNTSLCGAATPPADGQAVVIQLARMNRVRALDADNNTICVEAGCTLAALQQAAAAADRLFPLSLASEGSCQVGGNLSTNAGGVQVLRYGNMRELTLGLEVVLPDGRVWDGLRGLRKDNTGYDLKQLFIGAEGTLGIISAAVLKLFPAIRARTTAWAAVSGPQAAVDLLALLRERCGDSVSAFEIVGRTALELVLAHIPGARDPLAGRPGWAVLIELSHASATGDSAAVLERALMDAAARDWVEDAVVARSLTQADALWALREHISEAQRIEGISIKHDIAVPVSRIPRFLAEAEARLRRHFAEVRIVAFGHIGDGNLHYNLSCPDALDNRDFIAHTPAVNRIVHDLVSELGGSISAEHGIGQLKREELLRYKSALEIELMQAVKQVFDPAGRMNPGKILFPPGTRGDAPG